MSGCYTAAPCTCSPGVLTSGVLSFPAGERAEARRILLLAYRQQNPKAASAAATWSLAGGKFSLTLSSLLTPMAFSASAVKTSTFGIGDGPGSLFLRNGNATSL